MKKIEELSPELQALIGFAKPAVASDDDINGDRARAEYLNEKYALWWEYFSKYSLTEDEIAFIESMIKPME